MSRSFALHTLEGRIHVAVIAAAVCALTACTPDRTLAPVATTEALAPSAVARSSGATAQGVGTQACPPDAKLIGRIAVSTADEPGTWWRLTKDRFDALHVTDYRAALEGFYGQSFPTLADAIDYLIDGVATWDTNHNGFVCAYEVRGTRAWLGDNALYLLGISDDKHFSGQ